MTQFDPNMVAQMLMQPVGRESLSRSISDENYFEPIEIPSPDRVAPLDMQGGFFIDPETAGKVAYGGAVTGASFLPGAGVVDAAGGAVDVFGQPLPSFGENIRQGNYFDAALQGLGVAGDVATVAAPLTLGASAVLGAMLKAPGAARKIGKGADVVSDASKGIRVFHGTNKNIDKFELGQESASGVDSDALFFSTEKSEAKAYGMNVVEADIDLQSPLTMDFGGLSGVHFDGEYRTPSQLSKRIAEINEDLKINAIDPESKLMDELKFFGFDPLVDDTIDGVIMNNISDPGRGLGDGKTTTNYMVFDTEKISMPGSNVASDASKIDLPTDSSKVNNLDMGVIKAKQVSEGSDTVLEYPSLFHGSTEKGLDFLNIEKSRRTSMGAIPAINATENKQLATSFTRGELGDKPEGEIYNLKGPFKILNLDSKNGRSLWEDVYGKDPQKALKDGYDGIQFNQVENMRVKAFYKDIDLADIKGAKEIQLFKPKINILKNTDVGSIAKVEPPTETKPGIIAFAGSGADFDEFKLEFIGTGEGAQAFGYGLYFSDSEDIAKFYKNQLTGSSFETKDGKIFDPYAMGDDGKRTIQNPNIRTSIAQSDGDIDKPIAKAERIIANSPNTQASELAEKDLIILRDLKAKGGFTVNKGKTYKVGIEAKPEELLDYDKPIGQQNEFVTERLKKVVEEINADDAINLGFDPFELGEKQAIEKAKQNMLDPDRTVVSFLNDWAVFRGEQATGEKLLDKNGIKGIKYYDANSRKSPFEIYLSIKGKPYDTEPINALDSRQAKLIADDYKEKGFEVEIKETGSRNYVIFDDKLVSILEKYGIVGPVAVSAMAGALKDDDGTL